MKARKVPASTAKSRSKLSGTCVVAMRPPTTPPIPKPRLSVTRVRAYAAVRCSREVSAASRLEWLGAKPAFPAPAISARPKACHGWRTNGKPPYPAASSASEAISVVRAHAVDDPAREWASEQADAEQHRDHEPRGAEAELAHVVQVDD